MALLKHKGAGILPICYRGSQLWMLLGREAPVPNFADSMTWSDFGGGPKEGETPETTACREGAEEMLGVLGNPDVLHRRLRTHTHQVIHNNGYVCYVVEFDWNIRMSNAPMYFRRMRQHLLERNREAIIKTGRQIYPDELLEKDEIAWFPIHYPWATKDRLTPLRPSFLPILRKLV